MLLTFYLKYLSQFLDTQTMVWTIRPFILDHNNGSFKEIAEPGPWTGKGIRVPDNK